MKNGEYKKSLTTTNDKKILYLYFLYMEENIFRSKT